MPISLDDLRAAWPTFGFALYGYDPAGSVTAEAIIAEQSIRATGDTAELALEALAAMLMPAPSISRAEPSDWTVRAGLAQAPEPDERPTPTDIFG